MQPSALRGLCAAWLMPLIFGVTASACDSTPEPKVPFKLTDPKPPPSLDDTAKSAARTAQEAVFQQYAKASDQPQLEGLAVPLPQVRALLGIDLDQDGDRDALVLHEHAESGLQLSVSLRAKEGFEPARTLHGLRCPESCAPCNVDSADVKALSATKLVAHAERRCGESGSTEHAYVLASLEASPRVYEQLSLQGETLSQFSLIPTSQDADGDGHDDVVLALRAGAEEPSEPEAELKLTWFDRPSGLALDPREPENTLSAWASSAQAVIKQAPEQAVLRAEHVLALHAALCRESGSAELSIGGRPGVPCQRGKSRSEALLALVLARAKQAKVAEAFAAYRALREAEGSSASSRALEKAEKALSDLPAARGISLRRGPSVEPEKAPSVRLPAARFVGNGQLFLQRRHAVLWDLEAGSESAVVIPTDSLVRDPSGALAVTAVEHTCAGYALRIERAPAPGNPYVSAPALSTPVLLPQTSTPGCEEQRAQQGGFVVLGWAPQGVVTARGSEVRVVPLSLSGQPAGAARMLEAGAPCPAPLPAGMATPDGTHHVEVTPFGVLIHESRSGNVELWRPEGYLQFGKSATEAAISPNGRRVAVVAAGTVYLLEQSS